MYNIRNNNVEIEAILTRTDSVFISKGSCTEDALATASEVFTVATLNFYTEKYKKRDEKIGSISIIYSGGSMFVLKDAEIAPSAAGFEDWIFANLKSLMMRYFHTEVNRLFIFADCKTRLETAVKYKFSCYELLDNLKLPVQTFVKDI